MLQSPLIQSIRRNLFPILFFLFVIWQLPGILPPVSYEGDAMSICASCEWTASQGWSTLGDKGYGYALQPFTYIFIISMKMMLPFASCQQIYSVTSSLAVICLQYLVILFGLHLLGKTAHSGLSESHRTKSASILLIALMLLPESYALAMYPNSAAFSMLLFVGGMLLILNMRLLSAVLLLSLAPFFRLDIVIIYPVLLPLLMFSGYSLRKSILYSFIYAFALSLIIYVGYFILDADIFSDARDFSELGSKMLLRRNLIAIFGFYGIPSFCLLLTSLLTTFRKTQSRMTIYIATFCWFAIILIHTLEFRFGNAAKHFSATIPFVVILTALALQYLLKNIRKWWSICYLSLIGISLLCGIRFTEFNPAVPQTTLNEYIPAIPLISFRDDTERMELVIGGGQAAMTSDEAVLTSGNIVYPFFIHNMKNANERRREELLQTIKHDNTQVIYICTSWEDYSMADMLGEEGNFDMDRVRYDIELAKNLERLDDPARIKIINAKLQQYDSLPVPYRLIHTESAAHRSAAYLRCNAK